MNLLLVIITQLSLAYYSENTEYHWPEDAYIEVKELRFGTFQELDIEKGQHECFVLDEIGPYELCGEVIGLAYWGDLTYVVLDVD